MQLIEVAWYKLNQYNWFLRIGKNGRMLAHIWVEGIAKAEILNTTYLGEFRTIAEAKVAVENTLGVETVRETVS